MNRGKQKKIFHYTKEGLEGWGTHYQQLQKLSCINYPIEAEKNLHYTKEGHGAVICRLKPILLLCNLKHPISD